MSVMGRKRFKADTDTTGLDPATRGQVDKLLLTHNWPDLFDLIQDEGLLINIFSCELVTPAILAKQDSDGCIPLHFACNLGYPKLVDVIVKGGSPICTQNKTGCTPLHIGAYNGQFESVQSLIKYKPNMNRQNKFGWIPLHDAVSKGHRGLVELLLDAGADINVQNYTGATALHFAACGGHSDIVRLLLERGASPLILNKDNRSPLHMLLSNQSEALTSSEANVELSDYSSDDDMDLEDKE